MCCSTTVSCHSLKSTFGGVFTPPNDRNTVKAEALDGKEPNCCASKVYTVGRGISHLFLLGTTEKAKKTPFKLGFNTAKGAASRIGQETLAHTRVSSLFAFVFNIPLTALNLLVKVARIIPHIAQAIFFALATLYHKCRSGREHEAAKKLAKSNAFMKLGEAAGDVAGLFTDIGRFVYLAGKYLVGTVAPSVAQHKEAKSFGEILGIDCSNPPAPAEAAEEEPPVDSEKADATVERLRRRKPQSSKDDLVATA